MGCLRFLRHLIAPLGERRAATAVEYAMLIALVALVAIGGLKTGMLGIWDHVNTAVTAVP